MANPLLNPALWTADIGFNPVTKQWEEPAGPNAGGFLLTYIGTLPSTSFRFTAVSTSGDTEPLVVTVDGTPTTYNIAFGTTATITVPAATATLTLNSNPVDGFYSEFTLTPIEEPINVNCNCDAPYPSETLLTLRTDLMTRLGFAAQAATPPPGMKELLNHFLRDAQAQLYRRFKVLRTERFYTWPMEVGTRFYDLEENFDPGCLRRLDPYSVTWAGIEDLNGFWLPLAEGIAPELYTYANQPGIPARYEIRQCIEVFPAPDRGYNLRFKGHFGLDPFSADAAKTTLDPNAVFLFALGNAKAHYQQPDAAAMMNQALAYIGGLVAGSHGTARYVPGRREEAPLSRPRFLPLEQP